jgi:hypothetical protein
LPEGLLSPFRSLRSLDGDTHLHLPVRSLRYAAMAAGLNGLSATNQARLFGAACGGQQRRTPPQDSRPCGLPTGRAHVATGSPRREGNS